MKNNLFECTVTRVENSREFPHRTRWKYGKRKRVNRKKKKEGNKEE